MERRWVIFLFTFIIVNSYCKVIKGTLLTGEKWYNWNDSEWIINQYDEYRLDSLQNVYQMYRYLYNLNGDISQIHGFSRADFGDHYTLSYSRTWEGYKEGGTYKWEYQYDLTGLKTGYNYEYDYWSVVGGSNTDNIFTYTYTDGNLSNVYETYSYFEYKSGESSKIEKNSEYTYSTDYHYDTENRILSEIKKSLSGDVWSDIERTAWTYEVETGTGIKETYDLDTWVNSVKMTRSFNLEGQYTSELREVWIENQWAQSQTDDLIYDEDGDVIDILTKQYDSINAIYLNKRKHAILYDMPTGIEEQEVSVSDFNLYQNYPNPFNPETEIKFNLAENSKVNLSVYNTNGQLVRTLLDGKTEKGYHTVNFDASELNSGMYLCRLDVNGNVQTKKMIMLK